MRDYSFGNFISALRERCGLSQYQLGALVGVSDKAVSKWENGVSKPRIGTIRKLSEVLDVSISELLTCEYDAFNKERKDLFAMKNEIVKTARKRMEELYGDNPPMRILNRFKTEKMMLDGQEILLWMGFFGKLQEKFCKENAYYDVKDAQTGASFIAWLLGGTGINPLPVHYYCPVCKKVEFVSDKKCGIDLTDKKCSCGSYYHKDGFGIDAANMYPFSKWNEIYVSHNGTELTKECMQEYFKDYGEIREIKINRDGMKNVSSEDIRITKFGLLSKEINKKFSEEIIILQPEEYFRFHNEIPVLTIIENVEEKLCSRDLLNMEFTEKQIESYFKYAVEKGRFNRYDRDMNMGKVLSEIEVPSFNDLLILFGFLLSTGAWKDNAENLYNKGIPLNELISCREDVYTYLYDKMNGKFVDNPSGLAVEIKESVRKGMYSNNRMPVEIENLLLECDVPEWYVESMKKILYLFPKTYIIALLKREICKFVMMRNS